MSRFEFWLSEYGKCHQHPSNKIIHNFCVPLISLSVIGALWNLPFPENSLKLNWGIVFICFCLGFYLSLNFKIFLGMLLQAAVIALVCTVLSSYGILLPLSILIFVVAWLGQFWGHKIEGRKPAFFQDIVFLLIGPMWVTNSLFDKVGIKTRK